MSVFRGARGFLLGPVLVPLLGACGGAFPPMPAERRARIEEETRLEYAPEGRARPPDSVVRVVARGGLCTGSVIDDRLVLTAAHCVTEAGKDGEHVPLPLADVRIELGGGYLPWGRMGATGLHVCPCFDQGAEGDVAVIVLGNRVPNDVPRLLPRTELPPRSGATLKVVGYGEPDGPGLLRLPGGFGLAMQSHRTKQVTQLGFLMDGSFECSLRAIPGDSGGPAIDQASGEIVGVAARGREGSGRPNEEGVAVFARLDYCRSVITRARLATFGVDTSYLPPERCSR